MNNESVDMYTNNNTKKKSSKIILFLGIIIIIIVIACLVINNIGISKTESKKENKTNSDITENEVIKSQNQTFSNAKELYNNGEYLDAYKQFIKIESDSLEYEESKEYIKNCKMQIAEDAINESEELFNNEKYTQALDILNKCNDFIDGEENLVNRLQQIEDVRLEKINKEIGLTKDVIISNNNINTLNISSPTKYLIFVSLNEQKVYIYKGHTNNWNECKSCICSSGIKGEETPPGNYFVENRGYSFYSEEYEQGAKYWVGFKGNYLFHSLPYNEDLTEIVDPTIGVPSSHGCIRLEEENAKWIYDNVSGNSRVIIR